MSTWLRLRRDRWSVAAMIALAGILFIALFGGAIVTRIVGHDGAKPFPYATSATLRPVGPWTRVPATAQVNLDHYGNVLPPTGTKRALLILGADGALGRDELIRVLDGARTSLEIASGGVLVALLIAIPVGSIAGYFGGPRPWRARCGAPDRLAARVSGRRRPVRRARPAGRTGDDAEPRQEPRRRGDLAGPGTSGRPLTFTSTSRVS